MSESIPYTPEKIIKANGIEICTDAFGDPNDPAFILLNGQGGQLIMWERAFCEKLAAEGLYVIRFDHRDVGKSTHFSDQPLPEMADTIQKWLMGKKYKPLKDAAYTLDDMVEDTRALMDALGIEKANLMGISMGGMIAQLFTLKYPKRVLNLVLYATSPGKPGLDAPTPEAAAALMKPPVDTLEERIEQGVESAHVMGGPKHELDEERARRRLWEAYERDYDPLGAQRQLAAVFATPPQYDQLRKIRAETLVIHGDQDPLIPICYGREIIKQIAGAKLHILENIGHAMPPEVWDEVVDAISRHVG